MYLSEIFQIFRNTYSFILELVDLTVFLVLNLRLAKIKPYATICISEFSRFFRHTSFLCYQVRNYGTLFFHTFSIT